VAYGEADVQPALLPGYLTTLYRKCQASFLQKSWIFYACRNLQKSYNLSCFTALYRLIFPGFAAIIANIPGKVRFMHHAENKKEAKNLC
jgi:hypothetical protein